MPAFVIFFLLTLLLSGVYLCARFARMLRYHFPKINRWVPWIASVAVVGFMMRYMVAWGIYTYLVLALFSGDLVEFILTRCRWTFGVKWWKKIWCGGVTGLATALALFFIGYQIARNIQTTHYEVTVPKAAGEVSTIRVVLMADAHIGTTIRAPELDALVARVNALSPDIVLLAGDIYDDQTPPALFEHSLASWQAMDTRHGVYYVAGNHELARYAGARMTGILEQMRFAAGVRFLEDSHILLDNAFYLIGRNDPALAGRPDIAELTRGLDKTKPILLLEHQPVGLNAAAAAGVDLAFFGHTHGGQIWPFGIAVRHLSKNEMVYGLAQFGTLQAITTSGVGAWKFPMRIGTKSEIAVIDIVFME